MDFEPSLLEKPTILALRATQDSVGESDKKYILEAVSHEVSTLKWTMCPAPWIPAEEGVICPVPLPEQFATLPADEDTMKATLDINALNALSPVPIEDGTPIYIRADADDASVVPAVMSVVVGATPRNPKIDGWLLDGVEPAEWSKTTEGSVEVSLQWANEADAEGATTAFFTTAGKFKPWRIVGNGSSKLDFQGVEGPIQIFAITRYLGEGTSWVTLEVVP